MKSVKFIQGDQLLPNLDNVACLLDEQQMEITEVDAKDTMGLFTQIGKLPNFDLKDFPTVGRIVRKTSERQSRWVVLVALNTWEAYQSKKDNDDVGLFLGLGTVDCTDIESPIGFDGSYENLIDCLLTKAKPLDGLTLLNSITASHIAELLNITGVNSIFSPSADAGAQAIIEAHCNIIEQRCSQALVAAGSQKITPWYILSNKDFMSRLKNQNIIPIESAAAMILQNDQCDDEADGEIIYFNRFRLQQGDALDRVNNMCKDIDQLAKPTYIMHTGTPNVTDKEMSCFETFFPSSEHVMVDAIVGYSGPTSAINAINIGLAYLRKNNSDHAALICVYGQYGQRCYFLIKEY